MPPLHRLFPNLIFWSTLIAPAASWAQFHEIPVQDLISRYTDPTSRFVQVDGLNVHYRDEGRGPPIILLHGILSSLHTWDAWTARLKKQYRVIRLDLPGHGLTGPDPDGVYSMPEMAQFMAQFMDRVGVRQAHLAGNSLGGWISWEFAARHPKRVNRLVLIDPAGYDISRVPSIIALARVPGLSSVLRHVTPRWTVRSLVRSVYGNPELVTEALVTRYCDLFLREGNRAAFITLAQTPLTDDRAWLPRIRAPTLVLWGERDQWISPADGQGFARDIPQARLMTFPGVGHVAMEEAPQATLKPVLQFLGGR